MGLDLTLQLEITTDNRLTRNADNRLPHTGLSSDERGVHATLRTQTFHINLGVPDLWLEREALTLGQ